ncbi:MAG UNVERIFIED_CONTAM: hypothetical protein LVR29_19870 [Microcystis novacekii LVE1205-3]|jgi:hypothetical protein
MSLMEELMNVLDTYHKAIAKDPKSVIAPSRILAKMRGRETLATVGKWRVSKTDNTDIKLPYENIVQKKVHEIKIEEPTTEQIPLTIQEEYDADKICEIFEEKRAGIGKGGIRWQWKDLRLQANEEARS